MQALVTALPEIHCRSDYQDKQKPWRFVLTRPVTLTLSNGNYIIIPEGYLTDFASVPRLLRGIVATVGRHNLAVLIHDYLYDKQYSVTQKQDWKADRLFADEEMLFWLRKCGVSEFKCRIMYWAVRLGGKSWWFRKSY